MQLPTVANLYQLIKQIVNHIKNVKTYLTKRICQIPSTKISLMCITNGIWS